MSETKFLAWHWLTRRVKLTMYPSSPIQRFKGDALALEFKRTDLFSLLSVCLVTISSNAAVYGYNETGALQWFRVTRVPLAWFYPSSTSPREAKKQNTGVSICLPRTDLLGYSKNINPFIWTDVISNRNIVGLTALVSRKVV